MFKIFSSHNKSNLCAGMFVILEILFLINSIELFFENDNIDTQTAMHVFINSKNRNYNKLNII